MVAAAISSMVAALAGGTSEPRGIAAAVQHHKKVSVFPKRPKEIRGVHVTMSLVSAGKLGQYVRMRRQGLNTVEVDVKDESGQVAFKTPSVPLARRIGAAQSYYDPYEVARQVHAKHVYLIGRIVVFQDPILSERMPSYALKNPDGSVWNTSAGLGWVNMYDTRVWKYVTDLGLAAAKAGFDEIQFDYMRFPSDGDVWNIVYPHRVNEKKGETIGRFARYAANRLHRAGALVGADLFGLAAHGNLGIGQVPAQDRPLRRHDLPDGVPVPLHAGRVRHSEPRRGPRTDRLQHAQRLPPLGARPQGRPRPLAPGLLARPHVHVRGREGAGGRLQEHEHRRLPALEPGRELHEERAPAAPRLLGRQPLDGPSIAFAPEAEAVVQPVLAVLPELDHLGAQAKTAPVAG